MKAFHRSELYHSTCQLQCTVVGGYSLNSQQLVACSSVKRLKLEMREYVAILQVIEIAVQCAAGFSFPCCTALIARPFDTL